MLAKGLALAVILALAAGTASAGAATLTGKVRRGTEQTDGTPFGGVLYRAAAGEANRLTVKEVSGRTVFRDSGAVIRVRGNCKSLSAHVAQCPFSEDRPRVKLGDRADRARLRLEYGPAIFGGSGADLIVGAFGYDELYGDGGRDTIRGAGGGDEIHGGGGSDKMFGQGGDDTLFDDRPDGPTSGDLFDGGPGSDVVDYSKRTKGLDLDLARKPVNNSGEGDRIVRVENINGGQGPDRIAGTGRRDRLDGGGGNDRIVGRGGPDFLQGRKGDDTILGGPGGDLLRGDEGEDSLQGGDGGDSIYSTDRFTDHESDREPDAVLCGGGSSDDVSGGPRDTITGCEFASPWDGAMRMRPQPQVAGDTATFTTRCNPEAGDACGGTISLKSPKGVAYGGGPFSLPDTSDRPDGKDTVTFSVPLTAEGEEALQAGGVVVVAIKPDEDTVFEVVTAGYRMFMQGQGR